MDKKQISGNDWINKCIFFLTGQTISLFGSMLVQYAIGWHITLSTKSGLMLTVFIIFGCVPQVLISLFAGVWADRFDRKLLIVIADSAIAVSTLILAILLTFGFDNIWLLFIISAIRSFGAGIQTPAVGAFLPDIVPEDKLMRVNGINASIQGAMMFIAPLAAGGLYGIMGLASTLWVDVVTAVIGISMLLLIKVDKVVKKIDEQSHVLREMTSGIRYVFQTKWLRQFLGFYLIFTLVLGPVMVLTPLMVARSFGDEAWRLVAHEVAFATGMTAGGLAVGILAKKIRNTAHMVIVACIAFGITTFAMGFSPNFWFYLGVMLPMGVTWPFINSGSMTVFQTKVQPEFLGRVLSLVSIIINASVPLSMAIFGPMADYVRVETLLVITGAVMIIIPIFMMRFKEMIAAGQQLPEDETAVTEVDSVQ